MKKIVVFVITCLILIVGIAPVSVAFAANLSDSIVLHLTATHTDNQVVINVNMITNTGISGMTLELTYDRNVFEFDGYAQGQALDMDLISTDLSEDPTLPIRFNWLKQNSDIGNDFSTGNILRLYFTLKSDCQGGSYEIGLKNVETVYIKNNNPTLKSAIIDKAVINIAENKITEIEIKEAETTGGANLGLIIGAAVFAVAAVSAAVAVLVVKIRKGNRRRKSWLKL